MTANHTHKNLIAQLGTRAKRRLSANTCLVRTEAGAVQLVLHETAILTANPDGSVSVNSGGFRTNTTKTRLNEWLKDGYFLSQAGGVWYWHKRPTEGEAPDAKPLPPFADGDKIGARGALHSKASPTAERDARRLQKEIRDFARVCAKALPVSPDFSGDCLYCRIQKEEAPTLPAGGYVSRFPRVVTLGDATGNTQHLRGHMREGYPVPSLIYAALRESGAGNLITAAAFGRCPGYVETARDYVARAVRRFCKRRLDLAGNR